MPDTWIHRSAGTTLESWLKNAFGWDPPDLLIGLAMLALILGFLCVSALFLIWLERKISARIQNRTGPMMTGPRAWAERSMWIGGLFQTAADAIKLLLKELIIPQRVDRLPFVLAPIIVFTVCVSAFVVLPFAPAFAVADVNIGLLYVVAISSLTVLSILMAGWSSNNKYSLLGGLRSAAQMLSYEVPLIFALLGPIVLAGTLSLQGMVVAQRELGIWFLVPSFLGAVIYFVASIAEVNRPPFDIPEAESELVAGYVSEYSGMMFAMFFLAEFCNMLLVCGIAVTVFCGGWALPFYPIPETPSLGYALAGAAWFFAKTYVLILIMMWIRWTFPRVRPDHLMGLGWKFLLPLAFVNLLLCCTAAMLGPLLPGRAWLAALLVGLAGAVILVLSFSAYNRPLPTTRPAEVGIAEAS